MSDYISISDDDSKCIIELARKLRARGAEVIYTGNNALQASLRMDAKNALGISLDDLKNELQVLKEEEIEK